jgi:hypothetical protein
MNPLRHLLAALAIALVGLGTGGCSLLGIPPFRAPVTGPIPARIGIDDQAILLSDHTVFVTVHYSCSAGNPGVSISFKLTQGSIVGSGTSSATCDGGFNTGYVDVGPGPFTLGPTATAVAELNGPSGVLASAGKMIVPFPPSPAAIDVQDQALLSSDGTVALTVDYTCIPGPGGNTVGKLTTNVTQGTIVSSPTNTSAICDDFSHTVVTHNGPGPFSEGSAMATAQVENSAGDFVDASGHITISLSPVGFAPATAISSSPRR